MLACIHVCECVCGIAAPCIGKQRVGSACLIKQVFSVQTTSNNVQEIIEGKVEKRTKGQPVTTVDFFLI